MDFKATRKALSLSQDALAELLGVNQATVSRFESGELVPNARTILALEALVARHKQSRGRGRAA